MRLFYSTTSFNQRYQDMYIVTTFYKLINISEKKEILKESILKFCTQHSIKGTILLADEGINSTVCAEKENMLKFYEEMKKINEFSDIQWKETISTFIPFRKMKIKLKEETVRLKSKETYNLDPAKTGIYLDSEEWNDLLNNENPILIDTRNYYEITMGSFKNAINPETHTFSELTNWLHNNISKAKKNTPIAMFCTGGIRCEKSTAYVKKMGFTNVYHLNGGILQYLQDHKNNQTTSLWRGNLFIFDDRLALNSNLEPITNNALIT